MAQKFSTDQGCAGQRALGLIVLASDETLEPELATCAARAGVPVYHSRLPSAPDVTPETLAQMERDLPATAALLPTAAGLRAIGYGCTSGTTVIGAQNVHSAVQTGYPGVPVTDPLTAMQAACHAMGAQKIGFLTPYVPEVSSLMRARLEEDGLQISAFASFEQQSEEVVARISEQSVLDAIVDLAKDSDLIFASCTNLRSFSIIAEAEARLDRPVISSNSALWWHMLRLSGDTRKGLGPGRLFDVV